MQVDEMEKAVDVAEKNMNRFGLTTQEIKSRRQWVHDTRRTVSSYHHHALQLQFQLATWPQLSHPVFHLTLTLLMS